MEDKAAYAKRQVSLRKIQRVRSRLIKFGSYIDEVVEEIDKITAEEKIAKRERRKYKY